MASLRRNHGLRAADTTWGFLAVFAAGVALRRAELAVVERQGLPDESQAPRLEADADAPAEALVEPTIERETLQHPTVAAATVLHDTSRLAGTLERIGEITVVVCAGAMLARSFDWRGLVLAFVVFVVARPIAVAIALVPTTLAGREKAAAAWLGIRGAGSLYYLAWASSEGALTGSAGDLVGPVITCVAASIVVHGITATPLVRWLDRSRERASVLHERPRALSS